jgi:hypothetical protein
MNMSFTRNQKHSSAYGEILAQKKIMNKACKGVIVDLRQLAISQLYHGENKLILLRPLCQTRIIKEWGDMSTRRLLFQ